MQYCILYCIIICCYYSCKYWKSRQSSGTKFIFIINNNDHYEFDVLFWSVHLVTAYCVLRVHAFAGKLLTNYDDYNLGARNEQHFLSRHQFSNLIWQLRFALRWLPWTFYTSNRWNHLIKLTSSFFFHLWIVIEKINGFSVLGIKLDIVPFEIQNKKWKRRRTNCNF